MKSIFTVLFVLLTLAMIQPAVASIDYIGEQVEISGLIYACDASGSGIQIDTGDEIVSVYGIGPAWYWEEQGVAFPADGESVTVYAYEITYSDGTTKLVADSITFGDEEIVTIDLRDDDGTPLWRQSGKNMSQPQAAKGNQQNR